MTSYEYKTLVLQFDTGFFKQGLVFCAYCAIAIVLASPRATAQETHAIQWPEAFVTVESEIRTVEGHSFPDDSTKIGYFTGSGCSRTMTIERSSIRTA